MLVFTLNMVVGFFCSIGVDMGYNSTHHQQTGTIDLHNTTSHSHNDDYGHSARKHNQKHHGSDAHSKPNSNGKDCCQTGVLQLTQLDKMVPANHFAHPIFLSLILPHITYTATLYTRTAIKNIKQFVRSDHPPIVSDVRIAIKSFQI